MVVFGVDLGMTGYQPPRLGGLLKGLLILDVEFGIATSDRGTNEQPFGETSLLAATVPQVYKEVARHGSDGDLMDF